VIVAVLPDRACPKTPTLISGGSSQSLGRTCFVPLVGGGGKFVSGVKAKRIAVQV